MWTRIVDDWKRLSQKEMKWHDYTVSWICAVQTEHVVACELLNEEHDGHDTPLLSLIPDDKSVDVGLYKWAQRGRHMLTQREI